MTEVADLLLPSDQRISTERRYEAAPPVGLELVEPGETIATTKEEEWISKKKTEVTNTKQIETRVKRQVVLEDGKVVEDTGPLVTTNTTEDTETQEHHQTELRKLGEDDVDSPSNALEPGESNAIVPKVVANPDGIVREVKEKKIVSREEIEEVKETEDVQHHGDITDEDFLAAVGSGEQDLRKVLITRNEDGSKIVSTGPRLVHESNKSKKVIDTEDTRELSSVRPDGKIVTESQRTTEHEEVYDDELPEDAPDEDYVKESSERYLKTREQENVDYLANGVNVGTEMRFKTETMEVERRGDNLNEPDLFDSLSARARRRNINNRQYQQPQRSRGVDNVGVNPLDRKDALTRKPLDFDQEEETRKVETSKWLEHHFGSDSRSSNNSLIDDNNLEEPRTSFFNVTIKSHHPTNNNNNNNNNDDDYYLNKSDRPERDRNHVGGGYKGISWSPNRHSPPTRPYNDYVPSPSPDYHRPVLMRNSPTPDYGRLRNVSPLHDDIVTVTPTPPQRRYRQRATPVEERNRYENGYISTKERAERIEEPPPDYSPPQNEKKHQQKARFADNVTTATTTTNNKTHKSGNIIGQSIRKLVGKIRSASAERKAKQQLQRAKRSPSPTYQQAQLIDSNIGGSSSSGMDRQPVQRYYLGEDPFAGSIYGRENKYDGVKPARSSRRIRQDEEEQEQIQQRRSQSTLGRFSKSTGRLVKHNQNNQERASQTLPRQPNKINVSIINTVSTGPAKPARTYKSNLARSKSLLDYSPRMYTSNPQLSKLEEKPIGLKSPGLISSLNRSQRDVTDDFYTTTRFKPNTNNNGYGNYGDETPTRLISRRRGSSSSTDYSETYHTTSRNDNLLRPSVTNTTKSFTKKTIPSKDGRSVETIQSSEVKSVTKSHYRGEPMANYYDERRYNTPSPVVIEVRNNYRK